KSKGGSGLRFLLGRAPSPSEAGSLGRILQEFPNAVLHEYAPVNDDNAKAGAMLAFAKPFDTMYHFDRADVIVSLDSDFLSWGPAHIRHTQHFASRRVVQPGGMNRLYVFEPAPTITGIKADHRVAVRPSD